MNYNVPTPHNGVGLSGVKRVMVKKVCWYFIGLLLLTMGQRLFVEAGFGAGSFDALCVGLGIKILTAGTWVWILGIAMMLISALLYRRKPTFLVLITSFIFGIMFDGWGQVFEQLFCGVDVKVRIVMYLVGIILAPLGTAIYFQSGFAKSAFDEFVVAIQERSKMSIAVAKTIVEAILCVVAFLIGGPIGITTFITAFVFGFILQRMLRIIDCFNII